MRGDTDSWLRLSMALWGERLNEAMHIYTDDLDITYLIYTSLHSKDILFDNALISGSGISAQTSSSSYIGLSSYPIISKSWPPSPFRSDFCRSGSFRSRWSCVTKIKLLGENEMSVTGKVGIFQLTEKEKEKNDNVSHTHARFGFKCHVFFSYLQGPFAFNVGESGPRR